MSTLHSCRQGKAQQPPTALFINSIQERRIHSNQWHAHTSMSARAVTNTFLHCALPNFCIFHSFLEDPGTNVVGRWKTTDKHIHTCTQCKNSLLLFCPSSEDLPWPTGKSAETTAKLLQWGDVCDIWRAFSIVHSPFSIIHCCMSDMPANWSYVFSLILSGNGPQFLKRLLPNSHHLCSCTKWVQLTLKWVCHLLAAPNQWRAICMFKKKWLTCADM